MTPPLTWRMAEALALRRPLLLLAEIEHPDRTARFWTGVGTLSWNGYDWTGVGRLGSITPIKHTSDVAIQEIVFSLTGVDPDDAAELSDDVRNLGGRVWLACLGDRGEVIPDPYQVVDSQLDFQSFAVSDAGEATISITARTGFYTLERSLDEVWSTEDQKQTYPTDSGLDLISGLQNQDIQWTPS